MFCWTFDKQTSRINDTEAFQQHLTSTCSITVNASWDWFVLYKWHSFHILYSFAFKHTNLLQRTDCFLTPGSLFRGEIKTNSQQCFTTRCSRHTFSLTCLVSAGLSAPCSAIWYYTPADGYHLTPRPRSSPEIWLRQRHSHQGQRLPELCWPRRCPQCWKCNGLSTGWTFSGFSRDTVQRCNMRPHCIFELLLNSSCALENFYITTIYAHR